MILANVDLVGALYLTRNLRPADVRELEATRYGELDRDELAVDLLRSWTTTGHAWLAYHGDRPACLFGATQPWPGMFSAYMLATPEFPAVALGVTKFVKQVFIPHLRERAHRIEARSIDGHEDAHRWLRLLGATEECRMTRFGKGGEDFVVFTLAVDANAGYVDNGD